jgi:flagellar motor switch protein FliN
MEAFAACDRLLAEAFSDALGSSLESMTSERPTLEWAPVPTQTAEQAVKDKWLWWEQPLTVSESTLCWVGGSETSLLAIGRHALSAAGIEDASTEDSLGTWREIRGQSLSSTCQAIGKHLKKEVVCTDGREASKRPAASWGAEFTLLVDGARHSIQFFWNDSVRNALQPPAEESPPVPPQVAAGSAHRAAVPSTETSRTLGLLLEVELPVSVSFGRAQLELKDVLKLNSGSIVELNRSITEPVELIVNNCVIARGEVVVVEGNYGVRIKQIISKEERLRTLH